MTFFLFSPSILNLTTPPTGMTSLFETYFGSFTPSTLGSAIPSSTKVLFL